MLSGCLVVAGSEAVLLFKSLEAQPPPNLALFSRKNQP